MAVNVRSTDLDQLLLMPPSVRDWLVEAQGSADQRGAPSGAAGLPEPSGTGFAVSNFVRQPPLCRGHHRFKTQYVFEATEAQRARLAARTGKPTELWPGLPEQPPF